MKICTSYYFEFSEWVKNIECEAMWTIEEVSRRSFRRECWKSDIEVKLYLPHKYFQCFFFQGGEVWFLNFFKFNFVCRYLINFILTTSQLWISQVKRCFNFFGTCIGIQYVLCFIHNYSPWLLKWSWIYPWTAYNCFQKAPIHKFKIINKITTPGIT